MGLCTREQTKLEFESACQVVSAVEIQRALVALGCAEGFT